MLFSSISCLLYQIVVHHGSLRDDGTRISRIRVCDVMTILDPPSQWYLRQPQAPILAWDHARQYRESSTSTR